MPNRIEVTKNHFDPEHTQELYMLLLIDQGYEIGDKFKPFEFRKWMSKRIREYKKQNGLRDTQPATSLGKERYVNYIRNYVHGGCPSNQMDISDFLEV